MRATVIALCAALSGCVTERVVYLPYDSDAGTANLTDDSGEGSRTPVDSGTDATSEGTDAGDYPSCPGLDLTESVFAVETNTCTGSLVNAQVFAWRQSRVSTCTWTGTFVVYYCDTNFVSTVLYLTGDWEPIGPGRRGVRFSFSCGVSYDCTLTYELAAPNQAELTCTSGLESCNIHLVRRG